MNAPSAFLRSMSLGEDLQHSERFHHYHPTRRAIPIVEAIARPGAATMVIAPYGSGKTIAAGVGALFVENDEADRETLLRLAERIAGVSELFAANMAARVVAGVKGKVVVLTGLMDDPLATIAEALGMKQAPKSVEGFGKAMRSAGWDHVSIVWDEFGRHLEGLVTEGRSADLDLVQRLAERTSRAQEPSMSFTLLLHQNLLSYANRLNETSRTEWRKVEGRFTTLRLIEDSQEFFELVAEVIANLRDGSPPPQAGLDWIAKSAIAAGWFDKMQGEDRVRRMLALAQPLTAGALEVLPTLVARVGQNERSLFSFLREHDLSGQVGIEEVYVSFSDAMRTDVGIGGTYKRWLETESARSRANTPIKRELLAAACLLQLGGSGERRRVSRAAVELAVAARSGERSQIGKAFEELVEAKLLLWRRHNDDVAVWHGADIDVALRVREERERRSGAFDLKDFLDARFPAPHVRAPGHNSHFGVNRYLVGSYVTPAQLRLGLVPDNDRAGTVGYALAFDAASVAECRERAERDTESRLVLVVPNRPVEIESAALELVAIEALQKDKEFLAADPMTRTEIDELHSVAFEHLAWMMRILLDPAGANASWYSQGRKLDVSAERPASVHASRLLNEWYRDTPRIANEQLMRAAASRTMQTSRVRVVSSILERADRPRLGYEEGDGSAEASIYRTVLERTGLRHPERSRFSDPDEISDPGLAEVWCRIMEFFRVPTDEGSARYRPLARLLDDLAAPPIGLPRAVMPVLVAAGFRHFARAVAIYKDGVYLPDTLGFQFDQMISAPEAYQVRVLEPTRRLTDYLSEICYAFAHDRPEPTDELIRKAHDAILSWLPTVPDGTRRSSRLDQNAKALLRAVGNSTDPIDLLVEQFPMAFGMTEIGPELVAKVERARMKIDRLRDAFADEAVDVILSSFSRYDASNGAVGAIKAWASCLPVEEFDRRNSVRIVDRSVIRKALETTNGRFSEKSLANSLSSILLQRSLDKWDDRTAEQFRTALRETRERIEAAALDTENPDAALRPIIEARVAELNNMLARIGSLSDNARGDGK